MLLSIKHPNECFDDNYYDIDTADDMDNIKYTTIRRMMVDHDQNINDQELINMVEFNNHNYKTTNSDVIKRTEINTALIENNISLEQYKTLLIKQKQYLLDANNNTLFNYPKIDMKLAMRLFINISNNITKIKHVIYNNKGLFIDYSDRMNKQSELIRCMINRYTAIKKQIINLLKYK